MVGTVLQLLIEGDYRARKPIGFLSERILPLVIIEFGHFQAGNGLVDQFQLLSVRSGGRRLSRRQLHHQGFPAGRIAVWRRNLPDFILNLLPIFVVDRKTRKGCKSRGSSARRFLDRFCFSLSVNADNSPGKRHRIACFNSPVFGHGYRAGIGIVDNGPIGIHILLLHYFIGAEEKSFCGSFTLFCIQLRMGRGIQDAVGIALRHHFFQIIDSRRHLKVRARCQSQGLFIIPADTDEILPRLFIDFKRHAGQGGCLTCRVLFDFIYPKSGIRPVGQGNRLYQGVGIHRLHIGQIHNFFIRFSHIRIALRRYRLFHQIFLSRFQRKKGTGSGCDLLLRNNDLSFLIVRIVVNRIGCSRHKGFSVIAVYLFHSHGDFLLHVGNGDGLLQHDSTASQSGIKIERPEGGFLLCANRQLCLLGRICAA